MLKSTRLGRPCERIWSVSAHGVIDTQIQNTLFFFLSFGLAALFEPGVCHASRLLVSNVKEVSLFSHSFTRRARRPRLTWQLGALVRTSVFVVAGLSGFDSSCLDRRGARWNTCHCRLVSLLALHLSEALRRTLVYKDVLTVDGIKPDVRSFYEHVKPRRQEEEKKDLIRPSTNPSVNLKRFVPSHMMTGICTVSLLSGCSLKLQLTTGWRDAKHGFAPRHLTLPAASSFELLLTHCRSQRNILRRKALYVHFYIQELTDTHNRLVALWLTGEAK